MGIPGIESEAIDLLIAIGKRYTNPDKCPIVFVGYSLGGLVLKQALLEAQKYGKSHTVFQRTGGAVFIDSPASEDSLFWRRVTTGVMGRQTSMEFEPDSGGPGKSTPEVLAEICYRFQCFLGTRYSITLHTTNGLAFLERSSMHQAETKLVDLSCEYSKSRQKVSALTSKTVDANSTCKTYLGLSMALKCALTLLDSEIDPSKGPRPLQTVPKLTSSGLDTKSMGYPFDPQDRYSTQSGMEKELGLCSTPFHLVQLCERELVNRFHAYKKEIRAFMRALDACQLEEYHLARMNIERLHRLLSSGFVLEKPLSPFLTLQELCTWFLQTTLSQWREFAFQVYAWITWTRRPLRIWELQAALSLDSIVPSAKNEATDYQLQSPESFRKTLLDVCCGLVEIGSDGTVQFAHQSVREYLVSSQCMYPCPEFAMDHGRARELLALTCLHSLTWQMHNQGTCPTQAAHVKIYSSPGGGGLLEYASANWAYHCRIAEAESYYVVGAIQEYLQCSFMQGCYECSSKGAPNSLERVDLRNLILGECASNGFVEMVKMFLEMGADVHYNHPSYDATPLLLAAASGHWNVAIMLIKEGASLSSEMSRPSIMHYASGSGCDAVLEILLEHGGDPNSMISISAETPLHWAARYNQPSTVRRLLRAGSDANKQLSITGETSLHIAATFGHLEVVQSMLEKADTTLNSNRSWTALDNAAAYGHTEIVKTLIERAKNMGLADGTCDTALSFALQYGHRSTVDLLLSRSFALSLRQNHDGAKFIDFPKDAERTSLSSSSYDGKDRLSIILSANLSHQRR